MQKEKQSKNYEKIPAVYEYIMKKVRYYEWSEYVYSLVKNSVPLNAKVLELGAGNCKFANYFKKYYPSLVALDISFNMLSYDTENRVRKVCADMVQLPFCSEFDLIYSNFDSINYITSKKALLKFFKGINSALSEEGIFTFDASLERNSLKHSKIATRKGNINDISFEQKSEYSKVSRIHKNTFRLKFEDNSEIIEIHRQQIYPFEEYFKLLEKAGLYVVDCFNAFSFREGNANSERVQFITKKVSKNAYMQ